MYPNLSFSLRLRRPHDELLDVVLSPVVVVEGGGVDAEGGGRLAPAAHGGPLKVERSVVVVFVVVVQEEAEKAQKTIQLCQELRIPSRCH